MLASYKFILICSVSFLFACGNSSNSTEENKVSAKKSTMLPSDSMSREALFYFVDGCIGSFKLALGEEKAYAFCKCMYDQVRTNNPDLDSAKIRDMVSDTAQAAKMAENCR